MKLIPHLRHPFQEGNPTPQLEAAVEKVIDQCSNHGFHGTLYKSWLRIREEGIRIENKTGNTYLIADRRVSDKDIYSDIYSDTDIYSNTFSIDRGEVTTREISVSEYLARLHKSLLEVLDWARCKQSDESDARGIVIFNRQIARIHSRSMSEYRGIGFLSREGLLDEGSLTGIGLDGLITPLSITGYIALSEEERSMPKQEAGNLLIQRFYQVVCKDVEKLFGQGIWTWTRGSSAIT